MIKRLCYYLLGCSLLIQIFLPAMVSASSGEEVYRLNCMVCHGDDGSGELPGVPNLIENNLWHKQPEAEVLERLMNGIPARNNLVGMPPKGGNPKLTKNELKSSFRYLRSITKK